MPSARVVSLAAALVLALVPACSDERAADADRTTDASPSAAATTQPSAPSSPTPTRTTSSTPPSPAATTPPRPARAEEARLAPDPGTYRYSQSGSYTSSSESGRFPSRGTLVVERATDATDGVRQVHRRRVSDERSMTTTYVFTRTRLLIEHVLADGNGCTFDPPLKLLELPLAVGRSWTATSTCSGATVELDGSVLRRESRMVGGTSVDTFVVRTTLKVDAGPFSQTRTATTWVSPRYRLAVRSEDRTTGPLDAKSTLTSQLLSLRPS